MEPRPFARLSVASLALRFPQQTSSSSSSSLHHIHSASSTSSSSSASSSASLSSASSSSSSPPSPASPCFCVIKLSDFGSQTAPLPLAPCTSSPKGETEPHSCSVAASFYLDEPALTKLLAGSFFSRSPRLEVIVYSGSQSLAATSPLSPCWRGGARVLGRFRLPVGMELASPKGSQYLHSGWVPIGRSKSAPELHVSVRVELDPRYIFQFDGEPELSPQIVQIQGNIRQPIFTCKFTRDRSFRSRAGQSDGCEWGAPSRQDLKEKSKKERKGWLVLIYDLSGAAVAAASIVTPFVPTSGSDKVSRSNPGAWLIMKAGHVSEEDWRPWGKLEAWREKGGLGCRFQLMPEGGGVAGVNSPILVSETVIPSRNGGAFLIDTGRFKAETPLSASPVDSPHSSGDFYFSVPGGSASMAGFVMSADVQGEGKASKPHVELAMRHVTCVEDAAVFMALAAAVDLSMDACIPFSRKLGKSFRTSVRSHV